MEMMIAAMLFVLGAMLGSFACCQVWRLRRGDKSKWSHCLHCKYQLHWYDNIPIVSWLMLGGKCRKCKQKIGWAEILTEVGLAIVLALSFWCWPARDALMSLDAAECIKFLLFAINLTIFTILFIYDAKWKELPVNLMIAAIVIAAIFLAINIGQNYAGGDSFNWLSLGLALIFLPGLYYLMYRVSGESWVGGGDWILCVALALMLGDAWLALMAMFAANMLGSIIMLPVALIRKKKNMAIAFGPFLIVGFWLVYLAQNSILNFIGM